MAIEAMSWAWDLPIPQGPKLILLALADYSNAYGVAFPGQDSLARRASMSDRSVRSHVEALVKSDLVTVYERRRRGGSRTSNGYILAWGADRRAMPEFDLDACFGSSFVVRDQAEDRENDQVSGREESRETGENTTGKIFQKSENPDPLPERFSKATGKVFRAFNEDSNRQSNHQIDDASANRRVRDSERRSQFDSPEEVLERCNGFDGFDFDGDGAVQEVMSWIEQGCDPEKDIYPVVPDVAARAGEKINSILYFTKAILKARSSRVELVEKPQRAASGGRVKPDPVILIEKLSLSDRVELEDVRRLMGKGGTGPLGRMCVHWFAPVGAKDHDGLHRESGLLLEDYIRDLSQFPTDVVDEAFDRVRMGHKTKQWPESRVIRGACVGVEYKRKPQGEDLAPGKIVATPEARQKAYLENVFRKSEFFKQGIDEGWMHYGVYKFVSELVLAQSRYLSIAAKKSQKIGDVTSRDPASRARYCLDMLEEAGRISFEVPQEVIDQAMHSLTVMAKRNGGLW
ncbi:helix-turn-helix domain-containing protein [Kiloniella laminariae]|uniref:helix-turn-helix domain-containing protein n=1 Tax=Kiloniella laminariae TaxID=454162 RepID=UPI000377215B|nr:helix-turn-helix domain-containing protein [Kiloniella laminariae]